MPKLTRPQVALLQLSAGDRGVYAIESYKPVVCLLALGYIESQRGKWVATEAGRKALITLNIQDLREMS